MKEVATRVKIQHRRSNDRWYFSGVIDDLYFSVTLKVPERKYRLRDGRESRMHRGYGTRRSFLCKVSSFLC